MKTIVLRDYQKKAVNFCCDNLQSRGNSLLVAATGAGKTVMLGAVADYLVKNMGCKTVYVVVGRDKINRQNKETIRLCAPGIAVSEYSGRIKSLHGRIICMTQQTAARHYMHLPKPDVMLIDEVQHARAETYEMLVKYWAPRFLFGATATPDRGDKKSLITLFDNFYQIGTKQLIEMNYLCKPVFYPFKCNTYIKKDIITALSSLPLAPGKTIHFCRNHTMAKLLVDIIQGAGAACAYLADDKDNDPEYALFAGNSCNHLVNVDIATEGFDEPRIMNVVNWCSDGSRGRFVQKIGRGLRPAQNKTECRVFDCGGNIETYGDLEFTEILPEECVKLDGQRLCIADLFGAGGGGFKKPISKDSIFEIGDKSMPYAPPAGWFSFYDNDFGVVFLTNGGSFATFIKDNEKTTVDISCQADFEIEDFTLPGTNKSNGEINRWQLNQLTDVPTFGFTAQQANAVLAWKQWKKRYTHGK